MPKQIGLPQRLWNAARDAPSHTIVHEELVAQFTEPKSVLRDAINMLLSKNLFVLLQDDVNRQTSYRSLSKEEARIKGELTHEEHMVYSCVSAGGTKGVWRKHVITNTHLHTTVADKAIKKLISAELIKTVKDVRVPTRKVYMLYDLEPNTEITGGAFYSDHELDTAFIEVYAQAIVDHVRKLSFPKPRKDCENMLYPASITKHYPSATQITKFLKKTQLSDTILADDDVRQLLDMLVYSGELEALPSMRADISDPEESESDSSGSDSDSEESEVEEVSNKKRKSSKSSSSSRPAKRSRSTKADESDDGSDDDDDCRSTASTSRNSKKRKQRASESSEEEDADSDDDRRSKRSRSSRRSSASDSGSDSDSDGKKRKSKKRSSSKSSTSSKRSKKGSAKVKGGSPDMDMSFADVSMPKMKSASSGGGKGAGGGGGLNDAAPRDMTLSLMSGDRVVYRALRRDRGEQTAVSGWSQSPCGHCPRFDFCNDNGPINAVSCQYYDTWLEPPPVEEVPVEEGEEGMAVDEGGPEVEIEG